MGFLYSSNLFAEEEIERRPLERNSVSYYDGYGFITATVPFAKRAMLTYQTPATGCDGQYATSALGLETGTAVKVFGKEGESLYLYTARYYDAKGRVVHPTGIRFYRGTFAQKDCARLCKRHFYDGRLLIHV